MGDQLVIKKTAELAKEKGFNRDTIFGLNRSNLLISKLAHKIGCDSFISWDKHDCDLKIPTQALLQRWLREEHNININVFTFQNLIDEKLKYYCWDIFEHETLGELSEDYRTYEDALEIALIEALKLIK